MHITWKDLASPFFLEREGGRQRDVERERARKEKEEEEKEEGERTGGRGGEEGGGRREGRERKVGRAAEAPGWWLLVE